MLGKLIKYEFKSLFKTFSIAYILILVSGLLLSSTINDLDSIIGGAAVFAFIVVIFSTFIMLLIFTIKRFNKSLLSDEGYLMFTVPAKTSTIVWSKLLTMIFFNIVTILVVALVGFLMASISDANFWNTFNKGFDMISKEITFTFSVNLIVNLFVSEFVSIILIYLALAFGQIGKFKKHKNIIAIVFYFVVYYIYSTIGQLAIFGSMSKSLKNINGVSMAIDEITKYITFYNIYLIVFGAIFFLATVYILDKKLNLD